MEQEVPVEQLAIGMFVSELDRPWLDTPFLVQGFMIEDEATLVQLRQLCRQVVVDLSRSNLEDDTLLANARRANAADRSNGADVRVITAPRVSMTPATPARSLWLTRVFQRLGELPKATKPKPLATRLEGAGDKAVRPASSHQSQGTPVGAVRRPFTEALPPADVPPVQHPGMPSGNLLDWLRDGLDRLRQSQPQLPPTDALPDEATSETPTSGRPLIRVYQDAVPVEQELARANETFNRAAETVGAVIRDIRLGRGLQLEAVEDVAEELVESIVRHPGAMQLVSRLRESDESAYTHAMMVAVLLVSFGRELGYAKAELTQLGQVGMLLDIGKLRVDRAILLKRGNLTAEEFEAVKQHVQHGLDIIMPSGLVHPDVIAGIAQHHERLNGTGYPKGHRDGAISAFGQMAGIVDAFCALTSVRPYAEPSSSYDAMRQLQGWSGTFFNAGLVEQFIQAIGIFPVGTLVELSTGEIAVVLEQNRARRLKPKLLIISGPDKAPLDVPATLDLLYGAAGAAGERPYIRRGLPTEASAIDPKEYYLSR